MIKTKAAEPNQKIPLKADLRPEFGVDIFMGIV
jgi:hypothetical protein